MKDTAVKIWRYKLSQGYFHPRYEYFQFRLQCNIYILLKSSYSILLVYIKIIFKTWHSYKKILIFRTWTFFIALISQILNKSVFYLYLYMEIGKTKSNLQNYRKFPFWWAFIYVITLLSFNFTINWKWDLRYGLLKKSTPWRQKEIGVRHKFLRNKNVYVVLYFAFSYTQIMHSYAYKFIIS